MLCEQRARGITFQPAPYVKISQSVVEEPSHEPLIRFLHSRQTRRNYLDAAVSSFDYDFSTAHIANSLVVDVALNIGNHNHGIVSTAASWPSARLSCCQASYRDIHGVKQAASR